MAGSKEGERPRKRPSQQTTEPEQTPQPSPRVTGRGGRRSIDLAPYTPEEQAEIAAGVSEWEIQSRRIRERRLSANGTGEEHPLHVPQGQEGRSRQEKKLESRRRSYRKHKTKRLKYQKKYYQDHKADIAQKHPHRKHKSYQQVKAEVQGQQSSDHQPPSEQGQADSLQGTGQQHTPRRIFP